METLSPFRLNPLSASPSVERQTPNNDFGAVVARTVSQATNQGAGMMGPLTAAIPALSLAVSGVQSVTSLSVPGGTRVPVTGKGESWDLLEAQRAMQQESAAFNTQYLGMQNEIQRESREFNAVTNIMKVRHDSAKAAINNIR